MASKRTVDFSFPERDKKGNLVKNIMLIGRVGAGKSATANTLCGSKTFKSLRSSCPVTENILSKTVKCEQSSTSFCIIDTPGISGSTDNDAQFLRDLKKSIQSCDNGIHAILVVLSLRESFSQAVQDSFAYFSSILGCEWEKYGILVFTNADQLGRSKKSQNKYISKSEKYSKLVLRFNGRYITIDNTKSCQEQRSNLFSLILETIHYNEPSVFTTECLITENKFRTLQEGSDDEKKLKRILQEERNERERQLREQQEKNILDFKKQIQRTFKNPDTVELSEEADSECPASVVPNKHDKGYFVGLRTNQPPVDPITDLSELIEYENEEIEANDEIGNESTKVCAMCDAIHSLPIFCEESNIRICRKCANVHKRIPMLRSHRLEDNVLEHKETAKSMEDTICNLPANCSTKKLDCSKANYICFECNLVCCNTCVGQHQEEEPKHRSLNANQLRICCRHQKESFEKVLKVFLSLRKKRTICELYFHSDVVCEKRYQEKEERYLLIECDELKDMGNTQTLEVPQTREIWQKTFCHIICEIKSKVNKILQKRFIHLQDEDIMWILHDTNVLRQASKSGFSRDDMKKLDPSLMFAGELDRIYSKVDV